MQEVSFEVEEFEGLVVDLVVGWVSADVAGALGVNAQLSDDVVDHLLDPVAPEEFEGVQEGALVVLRAVLLAEVAGDEVQHDALVHLGAVVVVVEQDVAHFRAADAVDGGGEGYEDKQE